MSLLNHVFGYQTTNKEEQVAPPVQEITKDELIKKYQYNFKKSPMQNAFDEMASRFAGHCSEQKIYEFFTKYINSVKTNGYKCDDSFSADPYINLFHNDKQYLPFFATLCIRKTQINNDPPKTNGEFRDQHRFVKNELVKACPTYHEVQTDPKQSEICYLAALDYWKATTIGYFTTLDPHDRRTYYTTLDQSDRSKFLREYFFDKKDIRHPSI